MSADWTPLQAGMERFVDFDKGDFTGREALLKQQEEGIPSRLTGMVLDSGPLDAHGFEPVLSQGEIIGYVASGGFGHRTGQSIAFSYLPTAHSEPGTRLTIRLQGKDYPATVTDGPTYDPENKRLME